MSENLDSVILSSQKRLRCIRGNGFSMLETIWIAALILAISVGGFLAYSKVHGNAQKASLEAAAADVYRAAISVEMDGDDSTTSAEVQDNYNNSQTEVTITIIPGE